MSKRARSTKQQQQPEPKRQRTFTCGICWDEIATGDEVQLHNNKHTFCSDCLKAHIESEIQSRHRQIKCPGLRCPLPIEHTTIRDVFGDKWDEIQQRLSGLLLAQDVSYRVCPRPECGAQGFISSNVGCTQCVECDKPFCVECREPWHEGKKCAEIIDEGMLKYKKEFIKDCPRCSHSIEKNGGCIHVACSNCHFQFCWQCQSPWTHAHICPRNPQTIAETKTRLEAQLAAANQQLELLEKQARDAITDDQLHLADILHGQDVQKQIIKSAEKALKDIEEGRPVFRLPTPFQRYATLILDLYARRTAGDRSFPTHLDNDMSLQPYMTALSNIEKAAQRQKLVVRRHDLMKVLASVTAPSHQYMLTQGVPRSLQLIQVEGVAGRVSIAMPSIVTPDVLPSIFQTA